MLRSLRLLRSRPNILSLGTKVYGSNPPPSQIIHVQKVKFRKRWFKPNNFIIAACVYYFCFQVYKTSVVDTLTHWADEQVKELSDEEREEMEEEILEPLFIPFPFTTRLVESAPYRSTDPEWKAFITVNKNPALVKSIQSGLAVLTCKIASSNSALVQKCGNDMQLGRWWLDIHYPYRPPPVFIRKGLLIDDDGISIAEDPIEPVVALWIQRALWPSTLTLSLYSFSEALVKQNASNFAKLFGLDANPTPTPPLQQTIEKIHQQFKKSAPKSNSKEHSALPSTSTQAANGSSPESASPIEKRSTESSPAPGSTTASPGSGVSPLPIIPSDTDSDKPKTLMDSSVLKFTQEHTSGPWEAFKQKFAQTWRPIRELPPRGAIYVSGLVEITTARAFITVDVAAWWDPQTENFDLKTAAFHLKSLRMKTQKPHRGKADE